MHKFHWEPSRFTNLSRKEKAAVIAFIDKKVEHEKKEAEKSKRK